MISDNLKPLAQEYPELFKNVYCGACVGDGWVPLVREACEKMNGRNIAFAQIKEKFGTLRIYTDSTDTYENVKDVHEFLSDLEARSSSICEYCGEVGKLDNSQHWLKTLCPRDSEARTNRVNNLR